MPKWQLYGREDHDFFGLIVHGILLVVISTRDDAQEFRNTHTGKLILYQEGVTAFFHLGYIAGHIAETQSPTFSPINRWKWLEYSISATLGTVATMLATAEPIEWQWIVFTAIAGVAQQFVGFQIDTNESKVPKENIGSFALAAALQVAEFLVVGHYIRKDAPMLLAVYVVMWSSFGIHAGVRLYARSKGHKTYWGDAAWSDAVYSCLSWTAKVSVTIMSWIPDSKWATGIIFGSVVGLLVLFRKYPKQVKPDSKSEPFL